MINKSSLKSNLLQLDQQLRKKEVLMNPRSILPFSMHTLSPQLSDINYLTGAVNGGFRSPTFSNGFIAPYDKMMQSKAHMESSNQDIIR